MQKSIPKVAPIAPGAVPSARRRRRDALNCAAAFTERLDQEGRADGRAVGRAALDGEWGGPNRCIHRHGHRIVGESARRSSLVSPVHYSESWTVPGRSQDVLACPHARLPWIKNHVASSRCSAGAPGTSRHHRPVHKSRRCTLRFGKLHVRARQAAPAPHPRRTRAHAHSQAAPAPIAAPTHVPAPARCSSHGRPVHHSELWTGRWPLARRLFRPLLIRPGTEEVPLLPMRLPVSLEPVVAPPAGLGPPMTRP